MRLGEVANSYYQTVPADGPESFAVWSLRWAVVDRALDSIMGPTPRNYKRSPDLQWRQKIPAGYFSASAAALPSGNTYLLMSSHGATHRLSWLTLLK
jgi:hypothetical protein